MKVSRADPYQQFRPQHLAVFSTRKGKVLWLVAALSNRYCKPLEGFKQAACPTLECLLLFCSAPFSKGGWRLLSPILECCLEQVLGLSNWYLDVLGLCFLHLFWPNHFFLKRLFPSQLPNSSVADNAPERLCLFKNGLPSVDNTLLAPRWYLKTFIGSFA